jgi:peptide/nickel transport system substrate-binding protein
MVSGKCCIPAKAGKWTLAVILAVSLALAGCKAKTNQAGDARGSGPVTVVVGGYSAVTTLDDLNYIGMVNKKFASVWADVLMESDHKGNYTPHLAESLEWSADGLHNTVKLKRGIKFQNGVELTSQDVKVSFERIVNDKDLMNVARWYKFRSVDTPDRYTAVINFSDPMPDFEAEASMFPIICADAYNADPANFFNTPVGSGPYKVISTDFTNSTFTVERWDDWWGWTDANRSNVDRIIYKQIAEPTTRVYSLQTGEVDIAESLPFESIENLEKSGVKTYLFDFYQNDFLELNCQKGSPFADKRVREALSLSIDRELLVNNVVGRGTVATWVVPRGTEGYKEGHTFAYDPERAKILLKEAGYAGEKINLVVPASFVYRGKEIAQAIQSMAGQAGFNFDIQIVDDSTYMGMRFAGEYQVGIASIVYTQGSVFMPMMEIFGPMDLFHTGLVDSEKDNLLNKAAITLDPVLREKLIQDGFQRIIDNFGSHLYLFDEMSANGTSGSISNFTVYPDAIMELRYLKKGM